MRVVFWQNNPSIHQIALLRSLSYLCDVCLIFERKMPEHRTHMGWENPNYGDVEIYYQPDNKLTESILRYRKDETVHIFSGFKLPTLRQAFFAALASNLNVGLYSEARRWSQTKIYKIPLAYLLDRYTVSKYGSKIAFVLAIGHLGMKWFRLCGFESQKIYPFGYFVESPEETSVPEPRKQEVTQDIFKIVFIGSCIERKGIDILLKALARLRSLPWTLDIIGSGDQLNTLQLLSTELGIGNRVNFRGARSNSEALRTLQSKDLLVLPSRWDGWGAVVNEALMRGVPVVCSSRCGVADLLISHELGQIFSADSVRSLSNALKNRIASGSLTNVQREKICKWSSCISGESAARYLMKVIGHALGRESRRPLPPWLSW